MSRNDFVRKDASTAKIIDANIKNKWNWAWIDEIVVIKDEATKQILSEEKMSTWVEKVTKEGIAWCRLCDCEINYRSAGKRQLANHARMKKHQQARKEIKENYALPCKLEFCNFNFFVLSVFFSFGVGR